MFTCTPDHLTGPARPRLRALALGMMIAATIWALAGIGAPLGAQTPRIVVSGSAEVALPPDLATLDLGVVTRAATANEALADTSARMARVLELLQAQGIEPRDIQTAGLGLDPEIDYQRDLGPGQPPKVIGYVARNSLTVRVRDLAALGGLIDMLTADQMANSLRGLGFGLSDPRAAQNDARRGAVADARARAEVIANAAGYRLGPLVEIIEATGRGPTPMPMSSRMTASDSVPVAAGEVSLRAEVSMIWELAAP